MDLTTAIVGIVLVALCIVPIVLINRTGKKDNQENKDNQ